MRLGNNWLGFFKVTVSENGKDTHTYWEWTIKLTIPFTKKRILEPKGDSQ